MVVEFVSVCLFVHVQTRLYVVSLFHSTNDTTYLTHNKYVKVCGIFSETAPLQSYIVVIYGLKVFLSILQKAHV